MAETAIKGQPTDAPVHQWVGYRIDLGVIPRFGLPDKVYRRAPTVVWQCRCGYNGPRDGHEEGVRS